MGERHCWSAISKEVGWEATDVAWPTENEAESLCHAAITGDRGALVALLRLYRFLPSAEGAKRKMMDRIVGGLFHAKRMFCY